MLNAQGFCSMAQYYLAQLEQGKILQASFTSQTWQEHWFFDEKEQLFGIYETDIGRVTASLDQIDFLKHLYAKRDELCSIQLANVA